MIHFLIALVVVFGLTWMMRGFGNLGSIWTLVPSLTLLFIFGWALAIITGFATVHFQDTQHLMEIAFQMLFYATPVMYKADLLREHHLDFLVRYNPVLPFIDLIRVPMLENHILPLRTIGMAMILTLG